MTGFKNPALKQLTEHQVRFAPPVRRREQSARAEKLLQEIEPTRAYPYQFVVYRVTEYRPEAFPDLLIPGSELAHDLRLIVEALAVPPEPAPGEPMLTLEEISQRFNVSTKTIRRWRKFGLVGRSIVANGRKQTGYPESVVERFAAENARRVEKGSKFSQLSEAEKEEIVLQARQLSNMGSITQISRRIARNVGRSAETVRYTIKNFDREHPDLALFPGLTGPLDAQTKDAIYSSYRRGTAVDTLAKTYQRTRTSMYRVINEVRAQRLLEQPLDYIYNPEFDDSKKEAVILGPMPDLQGYNAKKGEMRIPKDVPPELAACYQVPLLNKEQEQHLFRKMNYLKHKASRIRQELCKEGEGTTCTVDPSRVRITKLQQIEDLTAEANKIKDLLINANMRLVVSIAKKHVRDGENIFELMSDGNMSLIRAVEKFDYGRNFKFSTYASWAIMKNFARSIPDEKHRRERFVTGHEEVFEAAPDLRSDEGEIVASQERAKHGVNRLLEYLEPRERDIIRMRAGLDEHSKNMTLEEIGRQFGITKERVRQLNARAMKKLRSIAEAEEMDLS